jgi:DNA-binding transcriptional MerR regulator
MLIGEFAERAGLSQRTVRHYDEAQVLQASGRSQSGYRLYAPADLDRARIIRTLRALSFTHPEIREALATLDLVYSDPEAAVSTIRRDLADLIGNVETRAGSLREQVRVASGFVDLLQDL